MHAVRSETFFNFDAANSNVQLNAVNLAGNRGILIATVAIIGAIIADGRVLLEPWEFGDEKVSNAK